MAACCSRSLYAGDGVVREQPVHRAERTVNKAVVVRHALQAVGRGRGGDGKDIMYGSIVSLVARSVQLLKRVGMNPEFTLIGGILRFESMSHVVREQIKTDVNVAEGDLVQYVTALGAAILGHRRFEKLQREGQPTVAGA